MRFKIAPETATIDWVDGAKIHLKRLTDKQRSDIRKRCVDEGITDDSVIGNVAMENMISGWENIDNADTDKPLEYTPETRKQVYEALIQAFSGIVS